MTDSRRERQRGDAMQHSNRLLVLLLHTALCAATATRDRAAVGVRKWLFGDMGSQDACLLIEFLRCIYNRAPSSKHLCGS